VTYLLDTNILIYWTKGVPSVVENIVSRGFKTLAASIISRSELYYGAYRSHHVEKNLQTIKHLSEEIRFLPLNEDIERQYGKLKTSLRREANLIDDFDILIAATAIINGCILVTNNVQHFSRIAELKIENWLT